MDGADCSDVAITLPMNPAAVVFKASKYAVERMDLAMVDHIDVAMSSRLPGRGAVSRGLLAARGRDAVR